MSWINRALGSGLRCSRGDVGEDSEDVVSRRPAVDVTAVVRDLHLARLQAGHEVEILGPADLAEDDVPFLELPIASGFDRAKFAAADEGHHRIAPWAEGHRLAGLEASDVSGGPAHRLPGLRS